MCVTCRERPAFLFHILSMSSLPVPHGKENTELNLRTVKCCDAHTWSASQGQHGVLL